MTDNGFTIGDLQRQLEGWPKDTKLSFGGGLTFYRIKQCDENEAYIEFNEAQAYLDASFKERNPHVKVAYISSDYTDWNEQGLLGTVDVSLR